MSATTTSTTTAPAANVWTVLRHGSFARYMAGEAISMLGTWMQQMAQGWVLAGLTASAFTLGLVTFASSIPMIALTMFGGVMADRFDKRRILFLAQIAQVVLAVGIGWLIARDRIEIWHLVLAGVSLGIVTAFEMPAASALVPQLVARPQLSAAIAVDRSVFHLTRFAGPALGGWLIATLGLAWAFYANALSFGALMVALLTVKLRPIERPEGHDEKEIGMKEGLVYMRGDRPSLAMISLLATATLCVSPFFMILMPLYSQHVLRVGPEQHGWIMAASGIGAFVGSLWLLSIPSARRRAYLHGGVVLVALAMSSLAAARSVPWAIASMISLTLGTSTLFGLANTILQERAPDHLRGRVSAIAGMSFFGVLPFAGLAIARLVDGIGMRPALAASALCFGLGATWLLLFHREGAAGGSV